MRNESSKVLMIVDRKIIFRETGRGWAIVVMPDNFRVDSYYHGVHVHPDRAELPIKDPQEIHEIICKHIRKEGKVVEGKLRKELGL